MDNKNLVILIAVAILFLVFGGGLGIFYQQQKGLADLKSDQRILALQALSSTVVPSVTAYGQVSNIDGKNLTLSLGEESMTIKIKDDAFIFIPATSTNDSGKTASPQKTAEFKDIKVGDNVNVNLKVFEDGQIEGQMVIILQK